MSRGERATTNRARTDGRRCPPRARRPTTPTARSAGRGRTRGATAAELRVVEEGHGARQPSGVRLAVAVEEGHQLGGHPTQGLVPGGARAAARRPGHQGGPGAPADRGHPVGLGRAVVDHHHGQVGRQPGEAPVEEVAPVPGRHHHRHPAGHRHRARHRVGHPGVDQPPAESALAVGGGGAREQRAQGGRAPGREREQPAGEPAGQEAPTVQAPDGVVELQPGARWQGVPAGGRFTAPVRGSQGRPPSTARTAPVTAAASGAGQPDQGVGHLLGRQEPPDRLLVGERRRRRPGRRAGRSRPAWPCRWSPGRRRWR